MLGSQIQSWNPWCFPPMPVETWWILIRRGFRSPKRPLESWWCLNNFKPYYSNEERKQSTYRKTMENRHMLIHVSCFWWCISFHVCLANIPRDAFKKTFHILLQPRIPAENPKIWKEILLFQDSKNIILKIWSRPQTRTWLEFLSYPCGLSFVKVWSL